MTKMVSNRQYNRCKIAQIMVSYNNMTLSIAALVPLLKTLVGCRIFDHLAD